MLLNVFLNALYIMVGLLAIPVAIVCIRWTVEILRALFSTSPRPDFIHRRGARLLTREEASENTKSLGTLTNQREPAFSGIAWGGFNLPLSVAWTHFLIQGMTGSGKTVLLKVFLDSVLPLIGKGAGFRAVIADPKRQMTGLIHSLVPRHVRVSDLNALSSSGVAWAIAVDVRTPAEGDQAAGTFVTEDKNEVNPFFRNNARTAVRALITALQMLSPTLWTLRDLVLLSRTPELLTEVFNLCPHTKGVGAQLFTNQKTGREIVCTLGSHLAKFETIAACWDHAPRAISLREFLDREEVLILGYDDAISTPLMALYPLMLKFLQDWILFKNDPSKPIFVIDEFRLFGKCDLVPLAIKSRESRASLMISFQDVNGVEVLIGEKEARELFGNLLSKCFLAADSVEAGKFASDMIGKEEGSEYTTTVTDSSSGRSSSWAEKITQRDVVMASEVQNLALASWEGGVVEGFYKSPFTGRYKASVPFRAVVERLSALNTVPQYTQRPANEQLLRPLTEADFNRLNIPITPAIRATL